uniref:Uncharacterized protein K02A2.6 n=1 Tax=Cacopsylla melanoneura TaxID=428564 RepID=A0A8D8M6Z3_9HEMI
MGDEKSFHVYSAPGPLVFKKSDLKCMWPRWKQKFDIYMKATGKDKVVEEDIKIAIFLNFIGDDGLDVYNNLKLNEKKTLADVLKSFDEFCDPVKHECMETFAFNQLQQVEGQDFQSFLNQVIKQAKLCNFECTSCKSSYLDRMTKDRLVIGILDSTARQELLRMKDLTLEKAKEICLSVESSMINKSKIEAKSSEVGDNIDLLQHRRQPDNTGSNMTYNRYQKRNRAPNNAWERVGIDIAEVNKKQYLVLVDYYSSYIEVLRLNSMRSSEVIDKCKAVFARFGIPLEVRTDNGPCFSSNEFLTFAKNYGFQLITSSPRYSQSNGRVENAVKSVKNILTKCDDPFLGLLAYRNSAICADGYSPAELLMGRRLRDTLPCLLEDRQVVDHDGYKVWCEQKVKKQITNYNERHSASDLKPLALNDRVWIVDLKRYGIVKRESGEPRSFVVDTSSGEVRRNRKFLILAPDQMSSNNNKQQVMINQASNAPQDVKVLVLESSYVLAQPNEGNDDDDDEAFFIGYVVTHSHLM